MSESSKYEKLRLEHEARETELAKARHARNEAEAEEVFRVAAQNPGCKVVGPFPTSPELPGTVVVGVPDPATMKKFRYTINLPDRDIAAKESKSKALPELALASVLYPSKEKYFQMTEERNGIADKVATAAMMLGEATEAELGKA